MLDGVKELTIGRLSDLSGVKIETIRYYERIGLMPTPFRSAGRTRQYEEAHARRLSFIRRSRELGFGIDDIGALLNLSNARASEETAQEARAITMRHLEDVKGKIASLRRLSRALSGLTEACRPGQQDACPIIDSLKSGLSVSNGKRARSA